MSHAAIPDGEVVLSAGDEYQERAVVYVAEFPTAELLLEGRSPEVAYKEAAKRMRRAQKLGRRALSVRYAEIAIDLAGRAGIPPETDVFMTTQSDPAP